MLTLDRMQLKNSKIKPNQRNHTTPKYKLNSHILIIIIGGLLSDLRVYIISLFKYFISLYNIVYSIFYIKFIYKFVNIS